MANIGLSLNKHVSESLLFEFLIRLQCDCVPNHVVCLAMIHKHRGRLLFLDYCPPVNLHRIHSAQPYKAAQGLGVLYHGS